MDPILAKLPYPRPEKYGSPYSEIYMSALVKRNEAPHVAERLDNLQSSERERDLFLGEFQAQYVRAFAKEEVPTMPPQGIDHDNADGVFKAVDEFVVDERYCCLSKDELRSMVKEVSTELVRFHVEYLVKSSETLQQAERRVDLFVSLPEWNNIMSPVGRVEVCRKTMCLKADLWASQKTSELSK